MNHPRLLLLLLVSLSLSFLPFGCKDESPCDEGEVAFGTGCFPPAGEGGAGPDPTFFGKSCETNDDCGGDAPVCDNMQFNYCLQIECQKGEVNEGACPSDWTCLKYMDNPSACVKF